MDIKSHRRQEVWERKPITVQAPKTQILLSRHWLRMGKGLQESFHEHPRYSWCKNTQSTSITNVEMNPKPQASSCLSDLRGNHLHWNTHVDSTKDHVKHHIQSFQHTRVITIGAAQIHLEGSSFYIEIYNFNTMCTSHLSPNQCSFWYFVAYFEIFAEVGKNLHFWVCFKRLVRILRLYFRIMEFI